MADPKNVGHRLGQALPFAEERDQVLGALRRVGQMVLSTLDLDQILDRVSEEIIRLGIFRSLMVALVDESSHQVKVVRSMTYTRLKDGRISSESKLVYSNLSNVVGISYGLDDDNVTAQVARSGEMIVIDDVEDNRLDRRVDSSPETWTKDRKVAYFIPVKQGDRVLAVLATASTGNEKEDVLHKIEAMEPLLDQLVIALNHSRLYQESQALNEDLERKVKEREEAEEALMESEVRYRGLFENSMDAVFLTKEDGQFVDFNPAFIHLLGYPRNVLRSMKIQEIVLVPENRSSLSEMIQDLGYVRDFEMRFRTQDDREIDCLLTATVWQDERDRIQGYQGILRDITESKRLKQEEARLERLRSLGEMAAGVSHNLNNILTGVLGPSEILKQFSLSPKVKREVDTIFNSALRARDLVRRLYTAVRGGEEQLEAVSISDVVQEVVNATRPRWRDEPESQGKAIEVETDVVHLPLVRGTRTGLYDMLVNLIFNAVDAMPKGGTISIRGQNVGGEVQLAVQDSGVGMEESIRQRVFEPFFTTKADVGTGLGLSTVYAMIVRWGGEVKVESVRGKGTTFILHLLYWGLESGGPEAAGQIHKARSGRVLVVDDETMVGGVLRRMLSDVHEVEVFQRPDEALKHLAEDSFDVALIDLGMPDMPGDQVALKIQEVAPLVSRVLMTGWELTDEDPRLNAFDLRLQKPLDDLRKIQDIVARGVLLHDLRVKQQG